MGFGEDFFTVLAALATPTAEELADARALRAEKRADDAERALRAERRATPMVDIKSAILAEAFGLPLAPKNTDLVGVLKGTDRYYRDEALRGLVNLGGVYARRRVQASSRARAVVSPEPCPGAASVAV